MPFITHDGSFSEKCGARIHTVIMKIKELEKCKILSKYL